MAPIPWISDSAQISVDPDTWETFNEWIIWSWATKRTIWLWFDVPILMVIIGFRINFTNRWFEIYQGWQCGFEVLEPSKYANLTRSFATLRLVEFAYTLDSATQHRHIVWVPCATDRTMCSTLSCKIQWASEFYNSRSGKISRVLKFAYSLGFST